MVNFISKLQFYLNITYYQLGKSGAAGVFALLTAMILFCSLSLPQSKQLNALQLSFANINSNPDKIIRGSFFRKDLSDPRTFFEHLPKVKTVDSFLKRIVLIANNESLPLDSGTYQTSSKGTENIVSVQVDFPLRGNYSQIKRFLAKTLNTLPNAALIKVLIQRPTESSSEIDADVAFILYFKKE